MSDQTLQQVQDAERWRWIGVALAAHTGWGMYPVLARYLQTVSGLAPLTILAAGNLIVLVVLGRFLILHTPPEFIKQPIIWVFAVIVTLRAVTNILSTRYTLAIYVQLITQATPFLVILMSALIFREKLPPFTIPAITLGLVGAVMMMGTDVGSTAQTGTDPNRNDWLGIGLAFLSTTALSTYMVMLPRTKVQHITGEALLLIQLIAVIGVGGVGSMVLAEDWTAYMRLSPTDWFVFLFFAFAVFLGANIGQINAIRALSAPLVSSMLAWRLVSSLVFGALMLNERLESAWQFLGAGIVALTITAYLWQQRT